MLSRPGLVYRPTRRKPRAVLTTLGIWARTQPRRAGKIGGWRTGFAIAPRLGLAIEIVGPVRPKPGPDGFGGDALAAKTGDTVPDETALNGTALRTEERIKTCKRAKEKIAAATASIWRGFIGIHTGLQLGVDGHPLPLSSITWRQVSSPMWYRAVAPDAETGLVMAGL